MNPRIEEAIDNSNERYVPPKDRRSPDSYRAKIERLRSELEHAKGQSEHFERENKRLQNKLIEQAKIIAALRKAVQV